MTVTAGVVSGAVTVGESTSPDYTATVSASAGTITQRERRHLQLTVSGGATPTVTITPPDGITKATFFWCKGTDPNGDEAAFSIEWNNSAAIDIDDCTELLWASKSAATGLTQVEITNLSATVVLNIEYIIAG